MREDSIEKKYDRAFEQATSLHPVFPAAAKREMAQMVEVIAKGNDNINSILSTNQNAPVKGGFIAEEFHAETFNLDAVYKGDDARAYTDRYGEWSKHEWNGNQLKTNDVPDIAVVRDGKVTTTAQSKYNATAEDTASQMSQTKDGQIKYEKVDQLIGPEDQINPQTRNVPGEPEPVTTTTVSEHATAKADALESTGGNKTEIEANRQTAKKATDTLKDGKSSSTPLTKEEADKMGGGDLKKLKQIESEYQTKSTLKQMGNAALGAAAMSAVVSGSMNTVRYIQLAKDGKISADEAVIKIVGETVSSAADSAIKASANAGVQSLLVRYGSKEAAMQSLAKHGLNSMLKSNAVTIGVSCAIDVVKDLVRLGMGNISGQEFFDRHSKGVIMTSAGVMGGGLGTAGAVSLANTLGIAAGSTAMTAMSVIGGLAGGMIAGVAMTMAIENGIEKPYRDLVRNTEALHDAAKELEKVSKRVLQAQVLFTRFIEANAKMDVDLQNQFRRIDAAGNRAMAAINKI